jgi:hypothetical protein
LLDRDQARLDQVQSVEEPRDLGAVAVTLRLVREPVVPPGRLDAGLRSCLACGLSDRG